MLRMNIGRRWGFLAAIAIGLSAAPFVTADNKTLQSVHVQGDTSSSAQSHYSGQLDSIGAGGRQLIIDDTLLNVSPAIKLDGAMVSRERLETNLSEGQTIRFQLSDETPSAREIISIETQ